jgi:hypothetical protein
VQRRLRPLTRSFKLVSLSLKKKRSFLKKVSRLKSMHTMQRRPISLPSVRSWKRLRKILLTSRKTLLSYVVRSLKLRRSSKK